jgi:hypothetical protein
MRNTTLAVLVLTLASIACGQQVVVTTPTIQADNTAQPITTPDNTPSLLPTPTAEAEAETEQAEVRGVVVNVRQSPAGTIVGQVYSGQPVDVLGCQEYEGKGRWCEIEAGDISGYVYEGCLNTESGLLCQAAE